MAALFTVFSNMFVILLFVRVSDIQKFDDKIFHYLILDQLEMEKYCTSLNESEESQLIGSESFSESLFLCLLKSFNFKSFKRKCLMS